MIERFFRILGAMLRAGCAGSRRADLGDRGHQQPRLRRRRSTQARAEVLRGDGLVAADLARPACSRGAAGQMLRVGRGVGHARPAARARGRLLPGGARYRLKRLTTLFEPPSSSIMGLIVGFVAIALVSAMYGIFNQVNIK